MYHNLNSEETTTGTSIHDHHLRHLTCIPWWVHIILLWAIGSDQGDIEGRVKGAMAPPPGQGCPIESHKSATAGSPFYGESAPAGVHFSEILSIRKQSMIWGRRKLSKRFCFPQNYFCTHCFPVGGPSKNIPLDCLSIFFSGEGRLLQQFNM